MRSWKSEKLQEALPRRQVLPLSLNTLVARGRQPQPQGAAAMVKTVLQSTSIDIPEGVKFELNAKKVRVTGPRGTLSRDFGHLKLDFAIVESEEGGKQLKVDAWFGARKTVASIRTATSHVKNLITGVTKGFKYKMRFVYAHFPINAAISDKKDAIEIRNFLGEKKVSSSAR